MKPGAAAVLTPHFVDRNNIITKIIIIIIIIIMVMFI